MADRPGSHPRMIRTRTRMLTFRITDDEFERLRAMASLSGARCLSDYLRDTVLHALTQAAKAPAAASDGSDAAQRMAQQLQRFEQRVNHLESRLEGFLAASPPSSRI